MVLPLGISAQRKLSWDSARCLIQLNVHEKSFAAARFVADEKKQFTKAHDARGV